MGQAELVLFSDAYQKFEPLLADESVVVVSGRASAREEQETKLLCDTVLTPDAAVATLARALHLQIDARLLSEGDLQRLQELLASSPGACDVFLRLESDAKDIRLKSRNTRVAPSRGLLASMRDLLGAERVRLVCAPPPLAAARPGGPPQRGGPRPANGGGALRADRPAVDRPPVQW